MKMVDVNERLVKPDRQAFCKRRPYKKRTKKTGASCEGYCGKVRQLYVCLPQSFADHWHYVELMGPGGKLWHDSTILLMHLLAGDDICSSGSHR